MVYEENNLFYLMSFRMSNQIAEVLSKLNIPSFFEAIPDYFLIRPNEADKKVTPGSIP